MADWTRAALADGAARAGEWFGCGTVASEAGDLAEALADWAAAERLDAVFAHEPAVGPWRAEAQAAEAALGRAGVRLIWIRREWDAAWWPRATRGYFPFWEEVKRVEGGRGETG